MRTISLVSVLSLVLSSAFAMGCSGAGADDGSSADQSEGAIGDAPTLTFAADGSVTQSGAIVEGGKVRVAYDAARLPGCRGDFEGKPGWIISGFASTNGGKAVAFETGGKTATIAVPAAGDLALWFSITNRWGCNEFDSKFGNNYHFTVSATPHQLAPSIVFDKDGQSTTTGELKAGGKVTIKFAQERLDKCRGTQNGIPQWNITGFASLNGAKATTFETSEAERSGNRVDREVAVALPESGDLAVWFENTGRSGCDAFDSNSGKNYHFNVH